MRVVQMLSPLWVGLLTFAVLKVAKALGVATDSSLVIALVVITCSWATDKLSKVKTYT